MPSARVARALVAGFCLLGATLPLQAQSATIPAPGPRYWLTGGAGFSTFSNDSRLLWAHGTALAAAGTVQYGTLVASARWARSSDSPDAAWDVGLLAGVGSPTRYPVHGSIAAGIGRVEDRQGHAGATVPLEVQLGWRLSPVLGVAVYRFGNLGGPAGALGAVFAVQLGRLQ